METHWVENSTHKTKSYSLSSNLSKAATPAPLRIYPMPFAREYADLLEDMKRTRPKFPEAPQDVPPAVVTFQQLDCADPSIWRHAHLAETFNYIRKSRRLRIPAEWQHLIPDKLDSGIWGLEIQVVTQKLW